MIVNAARDVNGNRARRLRRAKPLKMHVSWRGARRGGGEFAPAGRFGALRALTLAAFLKNTHMDFIRFSYALHTPRGPR